MPTRETVEKCLDFGVVIIFFSLCGGTVKNRKECYRQGDNIFKWQILAEIFYLENARTLNTQQEKKKTIQADRNRDTQFTWESVWMG